MYNNTHESYETKVLDFSEEIFQTMLENCKLNKQKILLSKNRSHCVILDYETNFLKLKILAHARVANLQFFLIKMLMSMLS